MTVLLEAAIDVSTLDFHTYDGYVDSLGLVYHEGQGSEQLSQSIPVKPVRQDVGNNPFEIRPESGDIFSQGEFDGGAGQRYFHRPSRNPKSFFYSEGLDFSDNKVRPLYRTQTMNLVGSGGFSAAGGGRSAQAGGALFVIASSTAVRRTTDLSATTDENPHAGEGTTNIYDITAAGDWIIVALGANGVHFRSTGGTYTHIEETGGSTDLDTGDTRKVAWLRNRLMVAGGAGRIIYEVILDSVADCTDASPSPILTLPSGWQVSEFFELGSYIYAAAYNSDAGQSAIFTLGMNSGATALEHKGTTWMPNHQLCKSGTGYLGRAFLGVGKKNTSAGYDPVLYQGIQNEDGSLQLVKIQEGEGAGSSDLSVASIAPAGESVYLSWSLGTGSPYGKRSGLARYDLANDAFFHHQADTNITAKSVQSIGFFNGKLYWVPSLLYYEDSGQGYRFGTTSGLSAEPVYLITSIADWNNMGLKVWRNIEVLHKGMPDDARIRVYYTTKDPEEDDWTLALTSDTLDSLGESAILTSLESRAFALKFSLEAGVVGGDSTEAPELVGFTVRSDPKPETSEWSLVRTFKVTPEIRSNPKARLVMQDPRSIVTTLRDKLHTWVTLYEPGEVWTAYVKDCRVVEPKQAHNKVTGGSKEQEAYIVTFVMEGTRQ